MRRALLLACLLTACSVQAVPPKASAQAPRFAVMDDYIRERLAKDWDAHANDPTILERGYCVRFQRDYWAGEAAWRVTELWPAETQEATSHSVSFTCPNEPNVATLHVHPPVSCDLSGCYRGGLYAYQCGPSDQDYRHLAWRGDRFGLVQCDRSAVVTYWPTGYR